MSVELKLWIKKILIVLAFVVILYAAWLIRSTLTVLLIAGFLTIVVNPLISLWERHKIHAGFTLIIVYIVVFLVMGLVVGTLIPIIINYLRDSVTLLVNWANSIQQTYTTSGIEWLHLPSFIEKGVLLLFWENNIQHTLDIIKQNAGNIQSFVTNQVASVTNGSISLIGSLGGTVITWGLTLVTTFLMVLERKSLGNFILQISPRSIDRYLKTHYEAIQNVTTSWIKATLTLWCFIFLAVLIGLTLVKWIFGYDTGQTLTLALIAGVMEFIPYIGPVLSLIPAVILGLGIWWQAALVFVILYLLIQRMENDILVPIVMSRALALSPLLVFIVMIAGGTIWGLLGIILAVPIAGIARVMYDDFIDRRTQKQNVPVVQETPKETPPSSPKKKLIAKS